MQNALSVTFSEPKERVFKVLDQEEANQYFNALEGIIKAFPSDKSLSSAPKVDDESHRQIDETLRVTEELIGDAREGDYYRCSRERFFHILMLAKQHLKENSDILDVGNAPGYLGIALDHMGHKIHGINLSSDWDNTYPSRDWIEKFHVQIANVEGPPLPFRSDSMDAIY